MSIQFCAELHFCKGNFISLSFQHSQYNCCRLKKDLKKCCKKYKLALKKTSQDEKVTIISILHQPLNYSTPIIISINNREVDYKTNVHLGINYKAPPPTIHSKIFISNCSYLI